MDCHGVQNGSVRSSCRTLSGFRVRRNSDGHGARSGRRDCARCRVSVTPPAGVALPEQRTKDQGRAVFDNLSPGSHLVSVTKEGFETYKGQATVGRQSSTFKVALRIAKLSSSIKVTGGRSPLANSDPNYIALRDGKYAAFVGEGSFRLKPAFDLASKHLPRDDGRR
jgi:hypothetical protein